MARTIGADVFSGSEIMSQSDWLEVALNGAWTRERQPLSLIAPEEIIEQGTDRAKAGVSILLPHAYDSQTNQQNSSVDFNMRITEGLTYSQRPLSRKRWPLQLT